MKRIFALLAGMALLVMCLGGPAAAADEQVSVPVLCYHRFGPTVADSMTTTTQVFAAQMKWLKDNGYTVIPAPNPGELPPGRRPGAAAQVGGDLPSMTATSRSIPTCCPSCASIICR